MQKDRRKPLRRRQHEVDQLGLLRVPHSTRVTTGGTMNVSIAAASKNTIWVSIQECHEGSIRLGIVKIPVILVAVCGLDL